MTEEKKNAEAVTTEQQIAKKKVTTFIKIMKVVGCVVIGLVILLIIAVWQLDRIVATTVPLVGSSLVGTPVELDGVSIKLWRGDVRVNGFRVGNPEGFHNDYAFEVENVRVDVDLSTVAGNEIVVEHIEISGLNLDYEYNLARGSNLQVILDNVNSAAQKSEDSDREAAESEAQSEKSDAAQKKVIIRKLILSDISMTLSSGVTRSSVPIMLPPIEMENIGEGKNLSETIAEVLNRVFTEIIRTVDVKKLGGSISDLSEDVVRNVDDTAGEAVRNVVDGANDFIKNLPIRGR